MSDDEKAFYSVTEFAKLLSITGKGVRSLIQSGKIKSIQLSTAKKAKYRIPKSELYRLTSSAYGVEDESV